MLGSQAFELWSILWLNVLISIWTFRFWILRAFDLRELSFEGFESKMLELSIRIKANLVRERCNFCIYS